MSLLNKKFYLASGWFTPQQRRSVEAIKEILRHYGVKFFSPEDDCPIVLGPNSTAQEKHEVFDMDVREIDNADVVIVNTADMDSGTIFEFGYSYAKDKVIIYFNDVPADQAKKRNLMLAMSAKYHARSLDELIEILVGNGDKYLSNVENEELE